MQQSICNRSQESGGSSKYKKYGREHKYGGRKGRYVVLEVKAMVTEDTRKEVCFFISPVSCFSMVVSTLGIVKMTGEKLMTFGATKEMCTVRSVSWDVMREPYEKRGCPR